MDLFNEWRMMRRFVFWMLCGCLWLSLSSISPSAIALPTFNRPIGVKVWNGVYHPGIDNAQVDSATIRCLSHNGQAQPFRDLVQDISLVGTPDRECLDDYQKRTGIPKQEIFNKYGATGQILCPVRGNPRLNDTFTGNYACDNNVLTASLHAFVNYDTGAIIHLPKECKIVLTGPNGQKMKPIPLTNKMIGGVDIFKKGLTNAERKRLLDKDPALDWAVVKTPRAPSIQPYTVYGENPLVESGGSNPHFISVSGPQTDMKNYGCRTISVNCPVVDAYAPNNVPTTWPREVFTQCDTNHGASGGADLQEVNGTMALVGIHSKNDTPGGRKAPIKWFDEPSKNDYKAHYNDSRTILVERNFKNAVAQMCDKPLPHFSTGMDYQNSNSEPNSIGHK